jgi:hypothetical protein
VNSKGKEKKDMERWGVKVKGSKSFLVGGGAMLLTFGSVLLGAGPAKEVVVQPGDNVQELVQRNPAGTTFHFKAGLYRGVSIEPKDRDSFIADPGAVLNGSQALHFQRRGQYWVASGQTNPDEDEIMRMGPPVQRPRAGPGGGGGGGGGQGGRRDGWGGFQFPGGGGYGRGRQGGMRRGPGGGPQGGGQGRPQQREYRGRCQEEYPWCIFPEDVFLDETPLVRVQSQDELAPGKWYSDSSAGEIYLADDPTGHKVEMSVTRHVFSGDAREVAIRGFTIEKYAQPAGEGAIDGKDADSWVVEQNDIRWNHGAGIRAGNGWKILNNKTHHNGDAGMGGSGRDILVEGNEMYNNNYAGYWPGWESGGAKFVLTENLVVRNNYAHDNIGPGLWTDINNRNTLYEGNRTTNNTEGIFHEISYHAVIRNNTIWNDGNNRFGHQESDAGILIGESRDVEVYGNKITDCRNGILGRQLNRDQDMRVYHADGPYEIRNLYVHDNDITQATGIAVGIVKPAPRVSDDIFTSWGNRFENNTFHLSNPDGDFFAWNNSRYKQAEWQKMMRQR